MTRRCLVFFNETISSIFGGKVFSNITKKECDLEVVTDVVSRRSNLRVSQIDQTGLTRRGSAQLRSNQTTSEFD
jgi:hypothetical protein